MLELSAGKLTHYDEAGTPLWTLQARSIRYFEGEEATRAKRVEVRFLGPDGGESLTVQAEALTFFHRSGDLHLTGGLEARGEGELSFSTEEARWVEGAGVLRGETPVRARRGELVIQGKGFEYHPQGERLTIQQAQVELHLRE